MKHLAKLILLSLFLIIAEEQVRSQEHAAHSHSGGSGINIDNLDVSVDPNVDFYRYSNGNWLRNNPIPPEYSRWSSWSEIQVNNEKILKDMLERVSADPNSIPNPNSAKLGDIYFSALNTEKVEKDGIAPIMDDLGLIESVNSKDDFVDVFSEMKKYRGGGLFGMWGGQDDKNSENVILQLFQGGLGMPDRDYYLKDDEKSKEIRSKYQAFMENMFFLLGEDRSTASKIAQELMDLETRLARASMSRVEMREAEATYHIFSYDELKALTPEFNWDVLMNKVGLEDKSRLSKGINVGQPEFFKEVNRMLTEVPVQQWKNYLKWNFIRNVGEYLSTPFETEVFNFYSKTLRGVEKQRERWRIGIDIVEDAMGEALGQLFVAEKFKPEARQRALEMVDNIKQAFADRLKVNEWMSEETKAKALEKLSTFVVKIGYTDKWRDFSGLQTDRNSLYTNMKNAAAFNAQYNLQKIDRPVDRTEWWMFPQTVNAYYSSSKNEIVFPAGIMQPPFFDFEADDAVNYGGIGMVIGHEITHGFDDQGRKYDANGNLTDWWTEDDAAKFKVRADKLVEQYNNYVVLGDLHVNGELTLGENIADLGGLIIAYYGLQKAIAGKDVPLIDGFTPEQRFFLSHSQVWRNNIRDEGLRLQVQTDPHSPGEFRVIGPISNMIEFMNAYGGKPGDPMINTEEERVVIW